VTRCSTSCGRWSGGAKPIDALAGLGIDIDALVPDVEEEFLALLGQLLAAAQGAGAVRADVTASDVKTLLVAANAAQRYNAEAAERVVGLMMDGLRPRRE
jgi:hypothetical protein